MSQGDYKDITSFKKVDRWQLNAITQKVNKVIEHIETRNITESNNLMRAISTFVAEKLGLKRDEGKINRTSHGGKEGSNEISMKFGNISA